MAIRAIDRVNGLTVTWFLLLLARVYPTGTAVSAQARIDGRDFRWIQGEELVKTWRHADGGFEKGFCTECGAHLFSRNPDDPSQMTIRMSAFDHDPGVPMTWRSHVAYAAPWEEIPDDGIERFDEGTPAF